MLKIVRLYNQNRRIVWLVVIIAIFCIAIISLVNKAYQEQSQANMEKLTQELTKKSQEENSSDIVDYEKAAEPLTSGENVHSSVRNEIQGVLEQFIKCVTNNQIQEAYSLLTKECKEIQYPSVESFEQSYCSDISNKTYDFQLWTSARSTYVYQVRFLDDMLSSGRDTSNNYLQDYITAIKQDGNYRLNINKLIKVTSLDKTTELHDIKFTLRKVETYLEYEYYEIEITNDSQKEIILDSREQDNSVYVQNSDGLKIRALLYENKEEDLKIDTGETKTIKIKFNNTYNGEKTIQCVGFSNVIYDQEAYQEDEKKGTGKIEIYLR